MRRNLAKRLREKREEKREKIERNLVGDVHEEEVEVVGVRVRDYGQEVVFGDLVNRGVVDEKKVELKRGGGNGGECMDFDAFDLRMWLPVVVSKLYKAINSNGGLAYMFWVLGYKLNEANALLQRIPLNFDDKEGSWFLKRELPEILTSKAGNGERRKELSHLPGDPERNQESELASKRTSPLAA
ncbi:hypothetical protein Fmac_026659 [Flemingia macrophylla]|uniref:Uncharacterized protein n=1 Tax=Flemingia macrophylla TaxID=520843 RepID=A0ABD1LH77_9FABA